MKDEGIQTCTHIKLLYYHHHLNEFFYNFKRMNECMYECIIIIVK